jgi:hypothetical protein
MEADESSADESYDDGYRFHLGVELFLRLRRPGY